MRNSGAARILLPYRTHLAGYADATDATTDAEVEEEPTVTQRFEQQAPYTATPTPTDIGAAYPVARYRVQVRQSHTLTPEAGSILYAEGVAAPSDDDAYFRVMPGEYFESTGGSPDVGPRTRGRRHAGGGQVCQLIAESPSGLNPRRSTWTTPPLVLNVWATIRDENLEHVIELGRMSRETVRRWRVRWDDRIYDHPLVLLKVVDRGDTFGILNVAEVSRQGRQRARFYVGDLWICRGYMRLEAMAV